MVLFLQLRVSEMLAPRGGSWAPRPGEAAGAGPVWEDGEETWVGAGRRSAGRDGEGFQVRGRGCPEMGSCEQAGRGGPGGVLGQRPCGGLMGVAGGVAG